MSNSYLDKFRSTLPLSQGNQILKQLISKRDSGEIRSVDEFKKNLQDLTKKILSERITPTLSIFNIIAGSDISSEVYNEMMRRVEDDLNTAFTEADNLDTIIDNHQQLIEIVALKVLRYGINELEAKVTLYEFINKTGSGFEDAVFDTFNQSKSSALSRGDKSASYVFIDPRLHQIVYTEEDAEVDAFAEAVVLGSNEKINIPVHSVEWIASESSYRSELNVSFQGSDPSNIIDGTQNTYWAVPLLFKNTLSDGAKMKLCFHLGGFKDLNRVEIEPASPYPMVLESIEYYDKNETKQTISITEIVLNGPSVINIPKISTNSLILGFRQDSFEEVQFTSDKTGVNFNRALAGESLKNVDMVAISEDLRNMLSSSFILDDILSVPTASKTFLKYYEYNMGFDNIRLNYHTFDARSIFVSKKKTVDKVGLVALRIKEKRNSQVEGSSEILFTEGTYLPYTSTLDNIFYHNSLEYWLVAQHFSEAGTIIKTDTISLPPLGATRIYHETLLLTESDAGTNIKNIGILNHYITPDGGTVSVYRNKTKLAYGTEWEFVSSSDLSNLTIVTPNSGTRMQIGIRILGSIGLLDNLTVSYNIQTSTTEAFVDNTSLLSQVDVTGDNGVRLTKDNVLSFSSIRNSIPVDKTDLYLIVILRRNSSLAHLSPALEEYMLITGTRNPSKFEA